MRKIILGSLKNDNKMCQILDETFVRVVKALSRKNIVCDYDVLFFYQYETDESVGVDVRLSQNFIEIVICQHRLPERSVIKKAMLRACVELADLKSLND